MLTNSLEIRYLVKAEEAEVTDHTECADSWSGGDLTCHLQADLHYLQRVGKDHLRASGLNEEGEEEPGHTLKLSLTISSLLLLHLTSTQLRYGSQVLLMPSVKKKKSRNQIRINHLLCHFQGR